MSECKACHRKRSTRDRQQRQHQLKQTPEGRILLRDRNKRYNAGRKNPSRVFAYMKGIAKTRQQSWDLTEDECHELISQLCQYCGGPLPDYGIGLDRLDNTHGYERNNVIPCCKFCNTARNELFTVDEMKQFIGPAIRIVLENRKRAPLY
jgi:hypothetical protein